MRLQAGTEAPSFRTTDFLGMPVDLHALRGRPVMLSFYRYASCPICNLRMHELITAHPGFATTGLQLLAVFQSSTESIAEYVGRQDAPFPIIADPDMVHYRRFGVETRWNAFLSSEVIQRAWQALGAGFRPGRFEGPLLRTPADFLIDSEGRIAHAHYGKNIDDHLPLARLREWCASAEAVPA